MIAIRSASPAKIAVFVGTVSSSQVVFSIRFAEELANEHDVVLIRPRVDRTSERIVSKHPKVRELRPEGCSIETFAAFQEAQDGWAYDVPTNNKEKKTKQCTACKVTPQLHREVLTNLANDSEFIQQLRDEQFDFAFTHHVDFGAIGIIHAAGIPQWGWVLSIPPASILLHRVGMPIMSSLIPGIMFDFPQKMTFMQRMKNFAFDLMFELRGRRKMMESHTAILRAAFGESFPHLSDLMDTCSLLVLNSNPNIEYPIPTASKVVYIGGFADQKVAKPLDEPFASFVEKAKNIVLISFGTIANGGMMPDYWREGLLELFRQNPGINFIWKMDMDIEVSSNVLRIDWQPQSDILANEKTIAFITHAGYNSIGEAIATATPLITIPLFGDQFRNSHLVTFRHLGLRVDKDNVSFETLNRALHELIDDPSYRNAALELQAIQRSAPVPPGDALRSAVNFCLDHPHFDRDLPRLPIYQLYNLDVIGLLILVLFLALYLIHLLLSWLIGLVY